MKSLTSYTEEKQTELFNKTGAFFAFDQQRFNEQKEEGIKYVSLDFGMFVPKANVDELLQGLSTIHEEGIKQDIEENGKSAIIQRELANYEAQITMCIDDTVDALEGYNFSREEIQVEYEIFFQNCIDNDLF